VIAVAEVAAGGIVGAPARFALDQWVSSRRRDLFPWGTFLINATGSFVLGLITGLVVYHGLGSAPSNLIGAGFCGAYTTFSTFSYETVRLIEEGAFKSALANVTGSLVVGLLGAGAGLALAAG
jgi:CrcB protein